MKRFCYDSARRERFYFSSVTCCAAIGHEELKESCPGKGDRGRERTNQDKRRLITVTHSAILSSRAHKWLLLPPPPPLSFSRSPSSSLHLSGLFSPLPRDPFALVRQPQAGRPLAASSSPRPPRRSTPATVLSPQRNRSPSTARNMEGSSSPWPLWLGRFTSSLFYTDSQHSNASFVLSLFLFTLRDCGIFLLLPD